MVRVKGEELDFVRVLRVLTDHGVRFVVIGGIAGALHGSVTPTLDIDILYDRSGDDLERLAGALVELRARPRDLPPTPPFRIDAQTLRNGSNVLFATTYGDLDCSGETPSGRFTYAQLAPTAETYEVDGVTVRVAALDELIRMKRATGREKDRVEVERLSALREEREGR